MTRHAIVLLFGAAIVLASCGSRVVRDAAVYQAELDQYDRWATRQVAILRQFMASSCACDGTRFAEPHCGDAADWVLTIEARHGWHRQMAMFNAGLLDDRPSAEPPPIPPTSCPLPAVPSPEVRR